ncbi:31399_t:CDS:2, partial [Gigaspora margarita]
YVQTKTNIFNSENNEDAETNDLDILNHEINYIWQIYKYLLFLPLSTFERKLSSERIVKKKLFKLRDDLEFEHAIYSFILDIEDNLIMEHFTKEELEEIEDTTIPEVPDLLDKIDDFLDKFLGK